MSSSRINSMCGVTPGGYIGPGGGLLPLGGLGRNGLLRGSSPSALSSPSSSSWPSLSDDYLHSFLHTAAADLGHRAVARFRPRRPAAGRNRCRPESRGGRGLDPWGARRTATFVLPDRRVDL